MHVAAGYIDNNCKQQSRTDSNNQHERNEGHRMLMNDMDGLTGRSTIKNGFLMKTTPFFSWMDCALL